MPLPILAGVDGHWETSPTQLVSIQREIIQLRLSAGPETGTEWVVQYLCAYGVFILPAGTPLTYSVSATAMNLIGAGLSGFAIVDKGDPLETFGQSSDPLTGFNPLSLGKPILTVIGGQLANAFTSTHPFSAAPLFMPTPGFIVKQQQTVQFRFSPFPAGGTPGPLQGSFATMAAYVIPRRESGR